MSRENSDNGKKNYSEVGRSILSHFNFQGPDILPPNPEHVLLKCPLPQKSQQPKLNQVQSAETGAQMGGMNNKIKDQRTCAWECGDQGSSQGSLIIISVNQSRTLDSSEPRTLFSVER